MTHSRGRGYLAVTIVVCCEHDPDLEGLPGPVRCSHLRRPTVEHLSPLSSLHVILRRVCLVTAETVADFGYGAGTSGGKPIEIVIGHKLRSDGAGGVPPRGIARSGQREAA